MAGYCCLFVKHACVLFHLEKVKTHTSVCAEVCQVMNAWVALENLGNLLKRAGMTAVCRVRRPVTARGTSAHTPNTTSRETSDNATHQPDAMICYLICL